MEDDINKLANGRRPQILRKWNTTSIFKKMEDDLIFFKWKMEDDLNVQVNLRQPRFSGKQKTTSISKLMEDYLNFKGNERHPQRVFSLDDNHGFLLGKAGLASQASPELGTAQPQLVL